jgi:hypothetical protein
MGWVPCVLRKHYSEWWKSNEKEGLFVGAKRIMHQLSCCKLERGHKESWSSFTSKVNRNIEGIKFDLGVSLQVRHLKTMTIVVNLPSFQDDDIFYNYPKNLTIWESVLLCVVYFHYLLFGLWTYANPSWK